MKRNNAFTLAELMITIGVVGVVAAITIPLLIQNSNYKKFTTQFRKSLSTLNQAAISAQAQYDMDYGTLTSDSTPSTCATDSLSGGQSTMCALLNNTLAGKTYMGVYGEVAGSMILTKYQFTKKTDGFDPANFLIYSMADGSIVGFNPSMKNCSLSGELTKSVLTDSNKLANCIGFIDVNGVSLPNKEVTCSDGTSALEPNNPCTLKSSGFGLGDVFPVVFHNGTVEPATNAAKAFFSGGSSVSAGDSNIIGYTSSGEPIYGQVSSGKKSITYKNNEYILMNGYYVRNDEYGNRIALGNGTWTKNADGNYVNPSNYVRDENWNILGKYKNGEWYDYMPDSISGIYVKKNSDGSYISDNGTIFTKTSDGYEFIAFNEKHVYDNNLKRVGIYSNNEFYKTTYTGRSMPNLKETPNGDLVELWTQNIYKKTSNGYEYSTGAYKYIYDSNMKELGAYHNGIFYPVTSAKTFVRKDNKGNIVSYNDRVYKKRDDDLYEYNGWLYDDELRQIGKE